MPEGYDTVVGERGDPLGRPAPARYRPRPLSNPADSDFRERQCARLRANAPSGYMAAIADGGRCDRHRLSTVRRADRIITLEGGMFEDGTHEDLIRSKGRYATLYRMQAGLHEFGEWPGAFAAGLLGGWSEAVCRRGFPRRAVRHWLIGASRRTRPGRFGLCRLP